MTIYLEIPCPRCRHHKLQLPERSGIRLYSKCAHCGKKSLYIIHDKIGGGKSYSIVMVGAANRDMVRRTYWIKSDQANWLDNLYPRTKSQVVRSALALYYSHTMRVKT